MNRRLVGIGRALSAIISSAARICAARPEESLPSRSKTPYYWVVDNNAKRPGAEVNLASLAVGSVFYTAEEAKRMIRQWRGERRSGSG
jgi:hypothetical protein